MKNVIVEETGMTIQQQLNQAQLAMGVPSGKQTHQISVSRNGVVHVAQNSRRPAMTAQVD